MLRLTIALSIIGCLSVSAFLENEAPIKNTRIIKGNRVNSITDYPFICSLQRYGEHFCGCSILNTEWVVTAAHCVEKTRPDQASGINIFMGSSDWRSGGVLKVVEKFQMHPKYNKQTSVYDIAVMKFSSPISYSGAIQPIKMATQEPENGTPCTVIGWGFTDSRVAKLEYLLRSTDVLFRPREVCASSTYGYGDYSLTETMVCGEGDNGSDSCQGDSGGPLINKKTGELVGVVSWGFNCGLQGYPGIYSNVAELREWVLSQLRAW